MIVKGALVALSVVLAACQTVRGTRQVHVPPQPAPQPPLTTTPLSTETAVLMPLPGIESPASAVITPLLPPSETTAMPDDDGDSTEPQARPLDIDLELVKAMPTDASRTSSAAVQSLIRQAAEARAAGNPSNAAASLERALRIEPRNYFVWSALGTTYLQARNYEQAESVSKKSNSLARGNLYAELENWRVIREVRAALGDADGAAKAQLRYESIRLTLAQVVSDSGSVTATP